MKNYTPRILIVDDIKENLITLEMNMRSLEAIIMATKRGSEALELVKKHDFALMIIDVQMPEMSGFDLAELIRNGRRNRLTPIIFLTAVYYDQNSIFQGYRSGAVDYITKPFNREILLSKARIFLELDQKNHELRESKQQFQNIVHDQTDLICRTDRNFNINFANRALLIAFTQPFESLKQKSIFKWFADNDIQRFETTIKTLSPTNAVFKINHNLHVTPTRTLNVSTVVRAIYDLDYELTGYQLVMRDITGETKSREDLAAAKKTSEQASQSRSQFLANMSHEIRTPMNSIIGMLDLMFDTNLDEDQIENLEVMKFSANKLLALLNDIIDFSKIDANRIEFQKEWFNLIELLTKTTRLLEPNARENGNEIKLIIDNNLPKQIKGDELRLGQILINLLNNANKFTSHGIIELKADLTERKQNCAKLRFTVSDTGIGMSEDVQKKIFNIYEQGDREIFQEYGGSGLGLSISKALCEKMGGTINVFSALKKGTSFFVDLNFEIKKTDQKMKNVNPEVLLVEDNKINRLIIENMLRREGFKYDIAENGQIAVDKFRQKPYGVIIMDLQMPVMDGFSAAMAIRELEKELNLNTKTKIIAHSANNTQEDQQKCEKIGMDVFLEKSGNTKLLLNYISKLTHCD
jgi:PAS domain S-box-containing protein